MKKLIVLLLAAVMIITCFAGCSSQAETTEEMTTAAPAPETTTQEVHTLPVVTVPEPTPEETTEPEETLPEGMMYSYLTGEVVPVEIGTRRPVAFQVDNEKLAMPQNGVAQAEVVYEVPIEANEVRMTAFFQDWGTIERIGPLRSCRRYHPSIVYEFDGILFHNGHSDLANEYLNDPHCDDLEGIANSGWPAIFQSSDHRPGHNDFSNPAKTDKRIEELGFRREIREDFEYKWKFAKADEPNPMVGGIDANKVKIGFTQNYPWFEYNPEDGLYYRWAREVKHIDEDNNQQVAVKNIIVQYCGYNLEWDHSTKNIWNLGKGEGVYISNGKAIEINWKKWEYWGNTFLYDSDGKELEINPGKTWYCIVLPKMTGEITIE